MRRSATGGLLPQRDGRFFRHQEVCLHIPSVGLLGSPDLVLPQGRAMRGGLAFLGRRAETDPGPRRDEAGAPGLLDGSLQGLGHGGRVHAVHRLHVPAIRLVARRHIFGEADVGGAVDGDLVVVIDDAQPVQSQVPGQRRGFRRHALHDVAVGRQHPGAMIHQRRPIAVEPRRQHALGQGHAHGIAEPLTQWAGGRFNPGCVTLLGMPRRAGSPLAERLQIVQGDVISRQVQEGVEQHGGMAAAEDKPIPIRPAGILGIELEETGP